MKSQAFKSGVLCISMLLFSVVAFQAEGKTDLLEASISNNSTSSNSVCGNNSYLEYVGHYVIDNGDPQLVHKEFDLIRIYNLIDQMNSAEKQIELQFVASVLPTPLPQIISGEAPYGARLYQAVYGSEIDGQYQSQNLLYANQKNGQPFAKRTNSAGRPKDGEPFIAFAGIEQAYPVQEHGLFANGMWDFEISCEQTAGQSMPQWVFRSFAPSADNSGGHDFAVKTYIRGDTWVQEIEGTTQLDYMYYTNVMIPSGGEYNLDGHLTSDEILITSAEIESVVIHSSKGDPWGDHDSGGVNDYSSGRFDDPSRELSNTWNYPNQYNGPNGPNVTKPETWLGWFVDNGESYLTASANIVHNLTAINETEGYRMTYSSVNGYYPKVFCGPTFTITLSDDKLAYCEMWFSPNAPSFWHGPNGLDDFAGFKMVFQPQFESEIVIDRPYKTYLPVLIP